MRHSSGPRNLIIDAASRSRVPAIYAGRGDFSLVEGLMEYGSHTIDQFRQAPVYVDRIFRGTKADDLPVQTPTKYETALNMRTAKAHGLDVPATVLARADEVVE